MTDGMPWLLLGIAFISYGIWIPFLGYYGDDWSYIWLSFKVHDLAHFFEGNRPNLVYFYNIINPILGPTPWHWHLFIFILRWFSILAFWWLLCSIWGKENRVVQFAALLFAVYPGFFLQANAVTFSIVFFFLTVFILSFIPLFYAIRYPRYLIPLTILGMVLSFINLSGSEYFYFLELLRPLIIWQAVNRYAGSFGRAKRILAILQYTSFYSFQSVSGVHLIKHKSPGVISLSFLMACNRTSFQLYKTWLGRFSPTFTTPWSIAGSIFFTRLKSPNKALHSM